MTKNTESPVSTNKNNTPGRVGFLSKLGVRVLFVVFLASAFPGSPTIYPTPNCSVDDAKKCLELKANCLPMAGDPIPVSITPSCLKDKPRICGKCKDAIIEFNMNFFERLYYYGPFWVKYLKRVFSKDSENTLAPSGTSLGD